MSNNQLTERRILVADSDLTAAFAINDELEKAGAVTTFPALTIEDALEAAMAISPVEGAVLSVELNGETTFAVARHLVRRNIPFVFIVGLNSPDIPEEFSNAPIAHRPLQVHQVIHLIAAFFCQT